MPHIPPVEEIIFLSVGETIQKQVNFPTQI